MHRPFNATLALSLVLACLGPLAAQDAPTPPARPAGEGKQEADGEKAEGAKETPQPADPEAKREARKERQAAKRAEKQAEAEGRPLAPEAKAARELEAKLNVPPLWASDGTVRLVYPFKDLAEQGDFVLKGFDAAEAVAGGGRGWRARKRAARQVAKGKGKNVRFELSAGSRGALLLHSLPLEDDFTITLTIHVVRSTTRSDFVAFVGKGGARFGSQLVAKRGSKFAPISKAPLVRDSFESKAPLKIQLIAKDGVLTTKINGVSLASSKKLQGKLDGQFGIYMSDMVVQLHQIEILARVDARKAKLPKE
tara:strand:- start:1670 stop:2596 length:927 start_codon:yes stop_codon:yes gene_type:complete